MAVPSSLDDIKPSRALGTVGVANVMIAGVGLAQLFLNVLGYRVLPPSFVDQYAPFTRHRFAATSIATAFLLVLLAYGGISLLRRKRQAVTFSNVVFLVEIVYFVVLWRTWSLKLSPLNPVVIHVGLFNAGLALQLVTGYPVIGLILLNIHRQSASR